ncbi:probable caffeoyl-CoA O-methyltransferase At4g26220 isoform X2 [Lotus japonicus]|uniref:probable caffeoyl-CoA O-methyltransferase At4g26220 isoform X2 n=1 Tax=Lotus japonicus TaxID=34305 RepID=UPI0025893F24|nr:probable caffeoyl-CoA O-methyltransferase At4g26220 isoform X2 [Lotus japonicus]
MSTNTGILQSKNLTKYILETSVFPREPKILKELRDATASHPWGFMGTAPDAGQLMALLLKLLNAKKTIEVGVFTGYSLLLTALSTPDDGKPSNVGTFEFAFVDADKHNYWNYHERLVKLVKIGGLIIYDNTLWGGTVSWPEEDVPANKRESRQSALTFNKAIAGDSRIEISVASVGDGFTICRRAH